MTRHRVHSEARLPLGEGHGFSLIELLVAMAVFLIVSAASFTLFQRHQALLSQQQGMGGLNIGLRNALTQIQIDAANAGSGVTPALGPLVPAWQVGVTITNQNPTSACNGPNYTYTGTCFDWLNVIIADPNTPPWNPQNATGGAINTHDTSQGAGTMYAAVPAGFTYTAAQYAANFKTGDTILLVSVSTTQQPTFTTVNLTAPGTAPSGRIVLTYTPTYATGVNPQDTKFNITTRAASTALGVSFQPTDWLVRLAPITYCVDATPNCVTTTPDPDNPKLMREVSGGSTDVVMDQVISFKVGAAVYDSTNDVFNYLYCDGNASDDSTCPGYNDDYTQVWSIRVTLVGRTPPNPTDPYRNLFDQGPYQVLGSSIMVNLRNLTMRSD
jgi:prepilin-type N-terminal cleavage/methylation domain-containing protein